MRLRSHIFSILAGGAVWFPLLVLGHGSEMMQVRLQFDASGAAVLEMTVDYAGNPMLSSEAEARVALQDILRVEVAGQQHKLTDLAPLRLEERSQLDPSSPMPLGPEDAATQHQLLTAIWHWRPTADQLRFTVPKGCVHDSLFWKQEPGAKPQWCVLLSGDFTPVITVPHTSPSPLLIGLAILGVVVLAVLGRRALFRRPSVCPLPPLTPSSIS